MLENFPDFNPLPDAFRWVVTIDGAKEMVLI